MPIQQSVMENKAGFFSWLTWGGSRSVGVFSWYTSTGTTVGFLLAKYDSGYDNKETTSLEGNSIVSILCLLKSWIHISSKSKHTYIITSFWRLISFWRCSVEWNKACQVHLYLRNICNKFRLIQKNQIKSDCKSSQLVGGWTNPFETYERQNGFIFPKVRGEHNKIFETTTYRPTMAKEWSALELLTKLSSLLKRMVFGLSGFHKNSKQ